MVKLPQGQKIVQGVGLNPAISFLPLPNRINFWNLYDTAICKTHIRCSCFEFKATFCTALPSSLLRSVFLLDVCTLMVIKKIFNVFFITMDDVFICSNVFVVRFLNLINLDTQNLQCPPTTRLAACPREIFLWLGKEASILGMHQWMN